MSEIASARSLAREEILKFASVNKSVMSGMQRLLLTAARALTMPAAFTALFNEEGSLQIHCWHGFDATSSPESAYLQADFSFYNTVQVIQDASQYPPFAHDVWTINGGVRFFATLPIMTSVDSQIGVLCILDSEPRRLTSDQQRLLHDFRQMASEAILLRFETSINRFAYKKIESESENLKEQLDRVISGLPVPFITVDENGDIRHWNRASADTFGYTQYKVKGKSILDLLAPEKTQEKLKKLIKRVYNRRRFSGVELELKDKQGTSHTMTCRLSPYYDAKGQVELCTLVTQPLQRMNKAEQKLRRTEAEFKELSEELERLKTVFLGNMSHELRTPLTSIIGFADILSKQVDDTNKEYTHLIEDNAQRLLDTLGSVLDLAQLEGQSLDINPTPLNLEDHTRSILDSYQSLAKEKDLKLILDCEADTYSIAKVDAQAQTRVIRNLVSNALKFTRKGKVHVGIRTAGGNVLVEVKDTGVGISKEFLPHVFDGFAQESSGLTRAFAGSGLGLAITKRLVELGGGTIDVESKKGKGTTFTVSYPQHAVQALAA